MRCIPLHLWCFFEPPIPSHQASWVFSCSLCLSLLLPLTRLQMPVYLFASSSRLLAPWEQQPSSSLYIVHQTAQCMAHRRYLVNICKMNKQGKKRGDFFFFGFWYFYELDITMITLGGKGEWPWREREIKDLESGGNRLIELEKPFKMDCETFSFYRQKARLFHSLVPCSNVQH